MRLLKNEQLKILATIDKNGLTAYHQLIKKKGWVYVQIADQSFAFHRKKTSRIIDGKFKDQLQYFVRFEGTEQSVADFDKVINALDQWLNKVG